MTDEQPGPPTEVERQRVSMEWLRVSQLRFCEGYKARMVKLHPMKRNAKGEQLAVREQKWSYAEMAEAECPRLPAHERERWLAGYLHADGIGAERGEAAMSAADPSRPPPRKKPPLLSPQEEEPSLLAAAPVMTRREAKEWWSRHRGLAKVYQDAGEQG